MKRIVPVLLLLLGALALTGCSSISVNHDYDTQADFTAFQTFSWMERGDMEPANAQQAQQSSDLLDRRIRSAIDGELAHRGMAQVTGADADVLMVYHLGTEEKVQVTDWGYNYSSYYWGYGGRQIDVYQYTQGTLIIDMVDARTHNLVWRGSGTKTVDRSQKSPEQLQAAIDEAVGKIMMSYPPK